MSAKPVVKSKKCRPYSHKSRKTKRCRCTKVCRISGGTRKRQPRYKK